MPSVRQARRRATRAATLALPVLLFAGCGLVRRTAPPVDRSDDPRIRAEVEARFAAEPALEAHTLRVEVDGRRVILHGSVRGIGAWQCAITNAELVEGVQTVVEYLVIERGPRDVSCLAPRTAPTSGGVTRAGS